MNQPQHDEKKGFTAAHRRMLLARYPTAMSLARDMVAKGLENDVILAMVHRAYGPVISGSDINRHIRKIPSRRKRP